MATVDLNSDVGESFSLLFRGRRTSGVESGSPFHSALEPLVSSGL